jgi:hypothetical protein
VQDAQTTTGGPTAFHAGFLSGNMGMTNIVFRNNTCDATAAGTRGMPYGFFVDGGRGCIVAQNTFTGKYGQGTVLFLTNDDYTQNYRNDNDGGVGLRLDEESRNARFNVVYDNDSTGGNFLVAMTSFSNLILGNRWGGGNELVHIFGRCSRQFTKGHVYYHYDNVIAENESGTVIRGFVETQPDDGNCGGSGRFNGRTGRTTVRDNHVTGTLTGGANIWLRITTSPPQSLATDGPDVVSGNTVG